jgi:nucleoside-diphosphate-sugar epimerase
VSAELSTLVIGGTGPTGPHIVQGLLERAHRVTILHGGHHEVDFGGDVEHLHGDPHFKESLERLVAGKEYDVVVATYGRLPVTCEVFRHRTGYLVAVGAAIGGAAPLHDPSWGPAGRPAVLREDNFVTEKNPNNKLQFRIGEARQQFFAAQARGDFMGTYLGYSIVFGPRQPAPREWCIVRRLLDGRSQMIVADGGIRSETRTFSENAAHGVLLAVDQREVANGNAYIIAGEESHTIRQLIETIAAIMDRPVELIDMPYDVAVPCHPLWQYDRNNRLVSVEKAKRQLGYSDQVADFEALTRTVHWLLENPLTKEQEAQLGDPFDYEREQWLISEWCSHRRAFREVDNYLPTPSHMYRHPKQIGGAWSPRS